MESAISTSSVWSLGLRLPRCLVFSVWIGAIAAAKITNAIIGIVKRGKFVAVHSVMNKLCGAAVFVLPLFLGFDFPWQAKAAAVVSACVFATAAAVHELIIILRKGEIL